VGSCRASWLEVEGRLVRTVHVERGRVVLMYHQPLAVDLAEPERGAVPQRAADLVEAVAERDIAADGDGQIADLVADGPSGLLANQARNASASRPCGPVSDSGGARSNFTICGA